MAKFKYLCIGCPLGCHLDIEDDESGKVIDVQGQGCNIGKKFAEQEHVDPRRMLTTTVRIKGGIWPKLPVKTSEAIPKGQVVELCKQLHKIELKAPINMGDVILDKVLGSDIKVVATRSMPIDSQPDY